MARLNLGKGFLEVEEKSKETHERMKFKSSAHQFIVSGASVRQNFQTHILVRLLICKYKRSCVSLVQPWFWIYEFARRLAIFSTVISADGRFK